MNMGMGQVFLSAVVGSTAFGMLPANAQDAQAAKTLEEVIVTAQKRAQSAQTVPISMLAVSGDYIASHNFMDIEDLGKNIPNVQVVTVFAASSPSIYLRGLGVSDFSPAVNGAVGISIDDVFYNSNLGQMFQLYDLERMEVLKGPQGTLQGHNTTGGLIAFQSRRPGFESDPSITLRYGRFNERSVEAAVSVPLIDDRLAMRLSTSSRTRDGTRTDNVTGKDWNDIDAFAARAQLLYAPSERAEILAKYEYGRNRSTMYLNEMLGIYRNPLSRERCTNQEIYNRSGCSNIFGYVDDADPYSGTTDITDQPEDIDAHAMRISAKFRSDGVVFDSITAWNRIESSLRNDIDASPNRIYGHSPAYENTVQQWTQELRLASDTDSRLQWIAGAYYLSETLDGRNGYEAYLDQRLPLPAFNPARLVMSAERYATQDMDSYAGFLHTTYDLTDRLTATAGARFTHEERNVELYSIIGPVSATPRTQFMDPSETICCLVGDPGSINPLTGMPTRPIKESASFNEPQWRVSLDYMSDAGLIYTSYGRGVRSGVFNLAPVLDPREFGYVPPEQVDMYEIGSKLDLASWLRLNSAAFYYTGDLQVFTISTSNIGARIIESAAVEGYGFESELLLRPVGPLTIGLNVGLLEMEFTDYPNRPAYNGNINIHTPKFSMSGSAQYDIRLSNAWTLSLEAEANYRSKVYFTPDNNEFQSQDGYALVDARVALQDAQGRWEVALWGKNLADKIYYVQMLDASPFGSYVVPMGEPRTYGVSVRFRL